MIKCKFNELVMYSGSAEAKSSGTLFSVAQTFEHDNLFGAFRCRVAFTGTGRLPMDISNWSDGWFPSKVDAEVSAYNRLWASFKATCNSVSSLEPEPTPAERESVNSAIHEALVTAVQCRASVRVCELLTQVSRLLREEQSEVRSVDRLKALLTRLDAYTYGADE